MTISTANILEKLYAAFPTYQNDVGLMQNMYQTDLLFSVETFQIDPVSQYAYRV